MIMAICANLVPSSGESGVTEDISYMKIVLSIMYLFTSKS